MKRPSLAPSIILMLAATSVASAQTSVDVALSFYSHGGAYCFRIAPEGVGSPKRTNGR